MTEQLIKALTINELLTVIGEEVKDWNTIVQVDIGSTNNYKVIKGLQVRGGHLVILVGERQSKNGS